MGLLDQYTQAAQNRALELYGAMLERLGGILTAVRTSSEADTGMARTLAYQYGVPSSQLSPRSMTTLPIVLEGEDTARVVLDTMESYKRAVYAGNITNLGTERFHAAWMGVDGGATGLFTVMPGMSVAVPCALRGLIVEPIDGKPAHWQVSLL